jgi:hypothetical protein
MNEPMVTNGGFGKALTDAVRKILSVPDNAIGFSVHFRLNEVIKVDCEYMPADPVKAGKYANITSLDDVAKRMMDAPEEVK